MGMNYRKLIRRRFVLGATATTVAMAGCTGGADPEGEDEASGSSGSGSSGHPGSENSESASGKSGDAESEETIADATRGDYARASVVHEQEYDGETVQVVGLEGAELPIYRLWLPHGSGGQRLYYPVEMDTLTSIVRLDDENRTVTLCAEATLTAAETIRTSLRPNPDTTIESV